MSTSFPSKTSNSKLNSNIDNLLNEIDQYANSLKTNDQETLLSSDPSGASSLDLEFSSPAPPERVSSARKPSLPNASLHRRKSSKKHRSPKSSPTTLETPPSDAFMVAHERAGPSASKNVLISQSTAIEAVSFPITIDISAKDPARRPSLLSIGNDSSTFRGPTFHLDTFSQKAIKKFDVKDPTHPHDPDTESDSDLDLKRFSHISTPHSEHPPSPMNMSYSGTSSHQRNSSPIQSKQSYAPIEPNKLKSMTLPLQPTRNQDAVYYTQRPLPPLPSSDTNTPTSAKGSIPPKLLKQSSSPYGPPVTDTKPFSNKKSMPSQPTGSPAPPIPSRPPPLSILMDNQLGPMTLSDSSDDREEEDDRAAPTLSKKDSSKPRAFVPEEATKASPTHFYLPPRTSHDAAFPSPSLRLRQPSATASTTPMSLPTAPDSSLSSASVSSSNRTSNASSTLTAKSVAHDTGYASATASLVSEPLLATGPLQYEAMASTDLSDLDGLVHELDKLLETGKASKRLSHLVQPSPHPAAAGHTKGAGPAPVSMVATTKLLEQQAHAVGVNPNDPKVQMALEKLAKAQIQKVATRIYVHDITNFRTVYLTPFMTADMVVELVLGKHRKHVSPSSSMSDMPSTASSAAGAATVSKGQWVLFELFNDLQLERPFKDWEIVMNVLKSWEHHTTNVLMLRKYNYYHSLSVDALRHYYPPMSGTLSYETKKGGFKKAVFELNPEKYALFMRKKSGQPPTELICNLFEMDVYTSMGTRKKQPTPYSFALKSMARKSMFEDAQQGYLYYFCVDTVEQMKEWVLALRNVKVHADELAHPEWFDEDGGITKHAAHATQASTIAPLPSKPLLSFSDQETKVVTKHQRPFVADKSKPAAPRAGLTGLLGSASSTTMVSPFSSATSSTSTIAFRNEIAGNGSGGGGFGKGTLMDQIDQKKGSQKSTNEQYHSTMSGTQKRNLINFIPDST